MAKLDIPPTKSTLLWLKRQLAFAEEGFDLLEQKRQILIFELMSRLKPGRALERSVATTLTAAFDDLRDSLLNIGASAFDRALPAVRLDHKLTLTTQHLVGMKLPRVVVQVEGAGTKFGIGGTAGSMDTTMVRFVDLLALLGQLAELQTVVVRLSRELRKTQRRCNALSKIFIPGYRETIAYVTGALEERERESFVILKMIRNELKRQPPLEEEE